MKYRVIEGGYWRHGSLHIESDNSVFETDAEGRLLFIELSEWLIENREKFSNTYNMVTFFDFFGFYPMTNEVICVGVNEEGCMWFIPESSPEYSNYSYHEGELYSSLHVSVERFLFEESIEFWDLFPEGHPLVPDTLEGEYLYRKYRPRWVETRKEYKENYERVIDFGSLDEEPIPLEGEFMI
jgi:hypothetical protein